eukprot:CCRYP_002263-RB/>CCRYP_002263-RB protein AED:0.30 eAED:0.64 QI:0/0/0/1/0/0/2/0/81
MKKRHKLTQLCPYHPLPPATISQHLVMHVGPVNLAMLPPTGQLPGRQFAKTKQKTAPVLQKSMPLTNASTTYYPSNIVPLT